MASLSLFDPIDAPDPPAPGATVAPDREAPGYGFFDAMAAAARVKLGAPPEWEWYAAKLLPGDDTLLEGGIPNRRQDGTPRKQGKERWAGVKGTQVVVTLAEIAAACDVYERETGRCSDCAGAGERIKSISVHTGRTWRPCTRCGATGRAPTVEG